MGRQLGRGLALFIVFCAYVNAEGDKHTPRDTSADAALVNLLVFCIIFAVFTMPFCGYYYYYEPRPAQPIRVEVVQTEASAPVESPFSGVSVQRPLLP